MPRDLGGINVQLIAEMNVGVQHSGQQVICRANSMKVARKVQINIFHGNDLGISATGRATFNTKNRSQRRLTQRNNHILAALGQRVRQTNGCGGLSFACRGRIDCSYQNKLARSMFFLAKQIKIDFSLVVSVNLKVFVLDAYFLGNFTNEFRRCRLSNFDIAWHVFPHSQ